jgi:isoleucyl-tRNA synthetase
MKFPEYKSLDLSAVSKTVLKEWQEKEAFEKSLETRKGKTSYVFYEGPPSANGLPGIHHVMARTIKDLFCRYKTQQGFYVERKAGWDTHGLPVELGVEKKLNITKEDIGKSITVEEYNNTCRTEVMQYTDIWEDITNKMGYWVDMNDPYITYENKYIESLWYLLKEMYDKKLLYKGYTIQPYSPAAGTGLSSHELNLPGCYRDVKDTTAVAMFKAIRNEKTEAFFQNSDAEIFFLAWTTTPWTLLSNTALTVNPRIDYVLIRSFNPYTYQPIAVILAKARMEEYYPAKNAELNLLDYKEGDKRIPYKVLAEFKGEDVLGARYEQLFPYQQPTDGDAFVLIPGDFVTTEDGTGIVHTAPSFGADDFRVCKANGVGSLTLVDKTGKFIDEVGEFSGKYVKNAYDVSLSEDAETTDLLIALKLKKEGRALRVEKYEHSYPHCWRTDKPVLYYPLDSWFIKTTAFKERMVELNSTINWKPASTGTGRFGMWLENLVDWNLSRSRYWGTPLPIWRTEDSSEEICIGSAEQLKNEVQKAVEAGFMSENPLKNFIPGDFSKENYESFDLHKPFVDAIVLVSASGNPMYREHDLIDVWFDSGAMPYAQLHYPFENKEKFGEHFPADFIAEGVDQTRGWFYTLHAISTMLFDSVAFKNIVSNGLVLDKNGAKMSKRLNNAVDPFQTIEKYGADPLRWYMVTNASPWENLKFDMAGVEEVSRKFFGTLYNTYSFFSLYANIDNFAFAENEIPVEKRPEIDRWIISLLNTLIDEVTQHYEDYEPTKVGRAIQTFVTDNLSNWYVRLNRKRFWGEEYNENKIAAYQTLYTCLHTVAKLAAPIAPFYMDRLYLDLNNASGKENAESVHLADFPKANLLMVNKELEERMDLAQRISSMILGLRRKVNIKVRQPLSKILIPALDHKLREQIASVKDIILTEVNIKEIDFIDDASGVLVKKIKPNFKLLGKKFGKFMKDITQEFASFGQKEIAQFEKSGIYRFDVRGEMVEIQLEEAEITSEDIPGWLAANDGPLTVALDVNISEDLRQEGIAREFVNKIQNLRKKLGLNVTDKIKLQIQQHSRIAEAVENFKIYIATQTLAYAIELSDHIESGEPKTELVEIEENVFTTIKIVLQ